MEKSLQLESQMFTPSTAGTPTVDVTSETDKTETDEAAAASLPIPHKESVLEMKNCVKLETIKFLQAMDQYLKALRITSEREITSSQFSLTFLASL